MRKDIYDMLNDIDIDLDELEKESFDDIEKKKIKKRFKGNFNNRNNKWIVVGASLALVVSIGFTDGGKEVIAAVANLGMSALGIEELWGIERDISDYKTVVNEAITHSGITVQLNEVILNGDELIISTTYKSNIRLDEEGSGISSAHDVKINGKRYAVSGYGYIKKSDNPYIREEVLIQKLSKSDFVGDIEMKIVFDQFTINGEDQKTEPFVFEFITNGDELREATEIVAIEKQIELTEKESLLIKEFINNPIAQKISYSLNPKNGEYIIELRGEDDLGNGIVFRNSNISDRDGYLELWSNVEIEGNKPIQEENYFISNEARTLTLTPYVRDFNGDTKEYKQVGETFQIEINR